MTTWHPPRFDNYQFAGRRAKAVEAHYTPTGWDTTGISFNDLQSSMHVHRRQAQRERRLETPEWSRNDKMLREVILKFCERRIYIRTRNKITEPSALTNEQRLAAIREKELKYAKQTLEPALRRLIVRQQTEKSPHLDIQIQNLDSQILIARRGIAGIAARVVHLYYNCGYNSVEVAQEIGIHPPLVRVMLQRLDHAHRGYRYVCPKWRQLSEWRAEVRRVAKIFRVAKRAAEQHERALKQHEKATKRRDALAALNCAKVVATLNKASRAELDAMMNKAKATVENAPKNKRQKWTRDRFMFCYFLHLEGKSWDDIAKKVGYNGSCGGQNVRSMFNHFLKHPDLLAAD